MPQPAKYFKYTYTYDVGKHEKHFLSTQKIDIPFSNMGFPILSTIPNSEEKSEEIIFTKILTQNNGWKIQRDFELWV